MSNRCQDEQGPRTPIVECTERNKKFSSYSVRFPIEIEPSGPWVDELTPRERAQLPGYIITVVANMKECLTLLGMVYGERIRSITLTPGESRDVELERETTQSLEVVDRTEHFTQILSATHNVLAEKFEDGTVTSDDTTYGATSVVEGGARNLNENGFYDRHGNYWTLGNQHYDAAISSASFTDLTDLRSAVVDMYEKVTMDVDESSVVLEHTKEDGTTSTTTHRRKTSRTQRLVNPSNLQSIRYDYYRLYEKFSLETVRESLVYETPFAKWRRLPRAKRRTNQQLTVREPLAYALAYQYGGDEGRRFLAEAVRIIDEEMPADQFTKTFCLKARAEHVESTLGACLATDEHTINMMNLERELLEARIQNERLKSIEGKAYNGEEE